MAELQLLVVESGALAAEDHRDLAAGAGGVEGAGRGLARREFLQRDAPAARGAAQHEAAVGHRFGEGLDPDHVVEQIGRTGGQRHRLRMRKAFGRDEHQPGQAHGLHRPRRGADVAGMLGTDQHHAQAVGGEQRGCGRGGREYRVGSHVGNVKLPR
jgi:hypothetical protein